MPDSPKPLCDTFSSVNVCICLWLQIHCDVVLNKKHQLSDWRIRKLPQDMIDYAQLDTHYLLCVHDHLKQELWEYKQEAAIKAVFDMSRKTCLIR